MSSGWIVIYVIIMVVLIGAVLLKENKEKKDECEWLRKNIRKVKLIAVTNGDGSQSYTTTHGAIGRAAIGSAIAGPVGGIIGASTASKRTVTTNEPAKYMFMVYLKDGSRKRDTVKETDKKFEIYMDYIDLGDE